MRARAATTPRKQHNCQIELSDATPRSIDRRVMNDVSGRRHRANGTITHQGDSKKGRGGGAAGARAAASDAACCAAPRFAQSQGQSLIWEDATNEQVHTHVVGG